MLEILHEESEREQIKRWTRQRILRGKFFRSPKSAERVRQAADNLAKAEKSDPFMRNRVISHFENGVCSEVADYEAQFSKEKRTTPNGEVYLVDVPKNIKKVCA